MIWSFEPEPEPEPESESESVLGEPSVDPAAVLTTKNQSAEDRAPACGLGSGSGSGSGSMEIRKSPKRSNL